MQVARGEFLALAQSRINCLTTPFARSLARWRALWLQSRAKYVFNNSESALHFMRAVSMNTMQTQNPKMDIDVE